MKKSMTMAAVGATLLALAACDGQKWSEHQVDSFMLVTQKGGPSLGYSPQSGVKILTIDGFAFKDLNRNDSLDAYEDWRLSAKERAADLASKLSIEEIAGLMLYSSHQPVPSDTLTAEQKKFLNDDHLRAVLITVVASPDTAAKWNNNMQALSKVSTTAFQPTPVLTRAMRQRAQQSLMPVQADRYHYGPHR